jgi:hypothetical protein
MQAQDRAYEVRVRRSCFEAQALMPAGADVLRVEFKVNLLRPAVGKHFLACGRVVKPRQTLTITQDDLWALPHADADALQGTHIAMMQATMIVRAELPPRLRGHARSTSLIFMESTCRTARPQHKRRSIRVCSHRRHWPC